MSSTSRDFTVISTFAGGGGSSLGYKLAGGRVLLAVEWDPKAAACYQANFPETPFYLGDIAALSVEECLQLAGIAPGELDMLDGSPPCQGFSTAGKREVSDPRNSLFREYVRLLRGLQPKAFVMENVSGLVKGAMRPAFREIIRELKASGYQVKCRLLDAKWFGVPQERKRLIWIGAREDLGLVPEHPKAQARPVTVREALAGCEIGPVPLFNDKYARLWPRVRPGQRADAVLGNAGFNGCVKLNPDRPSKTIPKVQTGRGFGTICHWAVPRAISIPEAKRLHSFPDDFIVTGTYQEQWAWIGNSVPPLLSKAIAEAVYDSVIVPAREKLTGQEAVRV